MNFRGSTSSRSNASASALSTGTSSRSGSPTSRKNSRSRNPMKRLFKGKSTYKSKNASDFLKNPGELDLGNGKGSLESITSIISAITLDNSLAAVPEAPAQDKFANDCADSKPPRCPSRRLSRDY